MNQVERRRFFQQLNGLLLLKDHDGILRRHWFGWHESHALGTRIEEASEQVLDDVGLNLFVSNDRVDEFIKQVGEILDESAQE